MSQPPRKIPRIEDENEDDDRFDFLNQYEHQPENINGRFTFRRPQGMATNPFAIYENQDQLQLEQHQDLTPNPQGQLHLENPQGQQQMDHHQELTNEERARRQAARAFARTNWVNRPRIWSPPTEEASIPPSIVNDFNERARLNPNQINEDVAFFVRPPPQAQIEPPHPQQNGHAFARAIWNERLFITNVLIFLVDILMLMLYILVAFTRSAPREE